VIRTSLIRRRRITRTPGLCPEPVLGATRARRACLAAAGVELIEGATVPALDRRDGKLAGIGINSAAVPSRLNIEGLFPLYAMARLSVRRQTRWSAATYGGSSSTAISTRATAG
jgi:hypothetical protein